VRIKEYHSVKREVAGLFESKNGKQGMVINEIRSLFI
jgi:hypothetical protein